jgi:hypothetical protein
LKARSPSDRRQKAITVTSVGKPDAVILARLVLDLHKRSVTIGSAAAKVAPTFKLPGKPGRRSKSCQVASVPR